MLIQEHVVLGGMTFTHFNTFGKAVFDQSCQTYCLAIISKPQSMDAGSMLS